MDDTLAICERRPAAAELLAGGPLGEVGEVGESGAAPGTTLSAAR